LARDAEEGRRTDWKELKEMKRRRGKEASYRESLVAGVYSVESMLV
jgi:hypothetical protein